MLTGLVASCNRYFRLTSARNVAQQQLLAVGTRLAQDLRQTAFDAVTAVSPTPDDLALAFPTCYDDNANYVIDLASRPQYQTCQVFYRKSADKTLRMLRASLGGVFPTPDPVAPAPSSVTAALSGSSQVLARYIKSFALVGTLGNPLTYRLVVETAVEGSQELKTLEVTSTIRIPR